MLYLYLLSSLSIQYALPRRDCLNRCSAQPSKKSRLMWLVFLRHSVSPQNSLSAVTKHYVILVKVPRRQRGKRGHVIFEGTSTRYSSPATMNPLRAKKKEQKHTTGGIPRWSPTLVLVARFSAYVWQSGRDAQFSLTYGRMYHCSDNRALYRLRCGSF
jgi:hypothetical protein